MRAALLLAVLLLTGCLGATPERARIVEARVVRSGDGAVLEVEQELRFSRTMLRALANGIDLRLGYHLRGCEARAEWRGAHNIVLRYAPLRKAYELDLGTQGVRHFSRRSAMLAALDRIRLPLSAAPPADCRGEVLVVLDLTSLPTPLRFPAFLQPEQWRMVSPAQTWLVEPA